LSLANYVGHPKHVFDDFSFIVGNRLFVAGIFDSFANLIRLL